MSQSDKKLIAEMKQPVRIQMEFDCEPGCQCTNDLTYHFRKDGNGLNLTPHKLDEHTHYTCQCNNPKCEHRAEYGLDVKMYDKETGKHIATTFATYCKKHVPNSWKDDLFG